MFDLIGSIKKKTGLDDLFGDGMSVPKSVQDVIKIDAVYSDGIFMTGKDRYSKTFKFTDINYAVSSKEDKEANFLRYSEILNSLENGISSQITIINRKLKKAELKEIALLERTNDDKDKYRKEINDMLTMIANGANAMGLAERSKPKKKSRISRRYPEILTPGEKVQIDVKEVPYNCLRGSVLRNNKHLYQWTAIDECTRMRFVYGFEEHTPENSVRFLLMVIKAFPFRIKTIQTDNGTEFTYKYISDENICPFDKALQKLGIKHKLIPPRTPWHNGKVERSHRNDQRYFYDWETFRSVEELNQKLEKHLNWSNNKTMRTLGRKSPVQLLAEKTAA